jgi:hypothetical protein
VLDTEKVESGGGSVTPYSGRGRGGAGVGRVNLTWSKTGGSANSGAGAARGGLGPRSSLGSAGAGGDFGSDRGLRGSFAPGQRNPLEIDMDALEDKPWRKPGADLSDYFNYGFTEETWRSYCAKQVHMRQEMSMQGKIRVWEGPTAHKAGAGAGGDRGGGSGGGDALPPELLALAVPGAAPLPMVIFPGGDHGMMGGPAPPRRFGPSGGGGGRRPPMRGRGGGGDEESVVQVLSGDGDDQPPDRSFPFHAHRGGGGGEEPIPTLHHDPGSSPLLEVANSPGPLTSERTNFRTNY